MLRQFSATLEFRTSGRGLVEITEAVRRWFEPLGVRCGVLTLFVRHTSASLLVQENADPEVRADFERFFRRLVPEGDPLYRHDAEGPDDMPSHIRAALTSTTLSIPVVGGRAALGTWQGIYLYEHRHAPHRRAVVVHVIGE